MCCENACYKNSSFKTLKFILIIITLVNFLLSLIALFIKAAKTERYKEALVLLEQRNNNTYKDYIFDECYMGGLFKDEKYCDINGTMLYKPSEKVEYQTLFKNYPNIEVAIDVVRLVFTGIYSIFLYYMTSKHKTYFFYNRLLQRHTVEETKNFSTLLLISLGFLIFLVLISSLCILIRALALTANMDIGLYEEGKQNEFESRTAINYIIDIAYIVLYGIDVGLVLRIKNSVYPKEIQGPAIQSPIQPPIQLPIQPQFQRQFISKVQSQFEPIEYSSKVEVSITDVAIKVTNKDVPNTNEPN